MFRRRLFLCWVIAPALLLIFLTGSQAAPTLLTHTTLADFKAGDSDGGIIFSQYQDGELGLSLPVLGITPWVELVSTPLPQTLHQHTVVAANEHLFIIGGNSDSGFEQDVYRAVVLADGTLGPWEIMPPLPQPLHHHAAVKAGSSLLVIGGEWREDPVEPLATVYRTAVSADGNLSNWVELTEMPLPEARSRGTAAVVNGYLFVIGGLDGDIQRQPTVYRTSLKADGSLSAWTTTTPLPVPLIDHAGTTAGRCLFIAGGHSDLGIRREVYSATVDTRGEIAAWQELSSARLPRPLENLTATVVAGQLFITGGHTDPPDLDRNEIYRATINADCTLEPWEELTEVALPKRMEEHAAATIDGHLFVTGGRRRGNFEQYDTVYQTAVVSDENPGGWQELSQSSLPQPLSAHAAALSGNYVFVTGGQGPNGIQTTVYRGSAPTEGQIGAWTEVAALPQPLHEHVTIAVANRLLTIGGHNGSTDQNTVYEAIVQAGGSLDGWQPHPCSLPVALSGHAAVLANHTIYLSGGRQGFAEQNQVYRLNDNDDGTQGCWQAVTALPEPLTEHAMAATEEYLFVSGGITGGGSNSSDKVYVAAIQPDGSPGAWAELSSTPLPVFLRSHVMVASNGYLYVVGGYTTLGPSIEDRIYRAKIKADGSLKPWQELTSTPLPQKLAGHTAVATDLYLLILGGYRESQPRDTVYLTPFYQGVHQAAYIHQFDLGNVQDIGVLDWQAQGDPEATLNARFRIATDDAQYGPWSEAFTTPPIPVYEQGRYLQYQLLIDNPNGGVKAVNEVSLTYGDIGDYIRVLEPNGNSVSNAEVYLNGQLVGITSQRGVLTPESLPGGLQPGDQLAILSLTAQTGTIREAHTTPDSNGTNWAYRTYLTNLEITSTSQILPYTVTQPGGQVITLRPDSPLVLFNLLVSIEWDADDTYIQQIAQAIRYASDYLYDFSDGQMAFGQVTIYDNAELWAEADIQISTKNIVRPHAYIGGITANDKSHVIRVGRFWDGNSGNQGAWNETDGFRTLAHEFGHYALHLYDEYFAYVFDQNGDLVDEVPTYCTGPQNRNPANDATNASVMDYQYTTSELSARNVPGLWSPWCEQTAQWQLNGESPWETLIRQYADFLSPSRWQFTTPIGRGGVLAGPADLPSIVPDWPLVEIYQDGPSTPPRRLTVLGSTGPYWGALVTLYTSQGGYPVAIDQGLTNRLGQIEIYGAQPGDTLRAASFDGALSGSVSVTNAMTYDLVMTPLSALQALAVPNLNPHLLLRPSSDGSTLYLRLSGLAPGGTLAAIVTQSGGTASQTSALSYSSVEQAYVGSVNFSAPYVQHGTGTVQVLGAGGNSQGISLNSTYALQAVPREGVTDLYSADGNLHFHLITGTVPVDAYAVISPLSAVPTEPPAGWQIVGNAYDVKLSGALAMLAKPALLKLSYDGTLINQVAAPEGLSIYHWDPGSENWQIVTSSLDEEQKTMIAPVMSLGTYALLALSGEWSNPTNTIFLPVILKESP